MSDRSLIIFYVYLLASGILWSCNTADPRCPLEAGPLRIEEVIEATTRPAQEAVTKPGPVIDWVSEIDSGYQKAMQATGKPAMILVTGNCKHCELLKPLLDDPDVIDLASKFICVKIESPERQKAWKVQRIPRLIFCHWRNGRVQLIEFAGTNRHIAPHDKEKLITLLKAGYKAATTPGEEQDELQTNDRVTFVLRHDRNLPRRSSATLARRNSSPGTRLSRLHYLRGDRDRGNGNGATSRYCGKLRIRNGYS